MARSYIPTGLSDSSKSTIVAVQEESAETLTAWASKKKNAERLSPAGTGLTSVA